MVVLNHVTPPATGTAVGQSTAVVSVQAVSSPDLSYSIPINYSGPLFDTGTLPLMQGALSFFDIVEVEVGVSGGSKADLAIEGTLTMDDTSPSWDLTMTPDASVWGKYSLGVTLLHIIAKAKAEIDSRLRSLLTVEAHDYDVSLDSACFTYTGGLRVWAGVLCLWDETCLYSREKYTAWDPFSLPWGCVTPAGAAAADEATPSPPAVGAALASDGFGHSATIWPGDRSALTATFFDGVAWSAPYTITTELGPDAPALAFFGPDRAVAAWAESSLTPDALTASPLSATTAYTDVLHSYHIATSVWEGTAWSAPQDLTTPTTPGTGEGKVALAACPASTAGCPANGAITAVWVRDVAGAPAQRQFRLFYATYQDGHWSAPLPVDPSSTGTDMQPSVAYWLGKPVVAWVRDADRSALTVPDRRIVWRILDGVSPVIQPSDLPDSIVYLALAMDGAGVLQLAFTRVDEPGGALLDSRHPLYYASGDLHGDDLRLELAEAAGQPRPRAACGAAPADHRQVRPSHHHLPGVGLRVRSGGQPVRVPGGYGWRDRPHG